MTERSLNDIMTIDHVVRVRDDGTVTYQGTTGVYAPEVYCDYEGPFTDGQILDEHERDMIESIKAQGWTVETGWSGQDSGKYNGAIMHVSEYIGGALAEHILETPGYWVACSVEIHPGEDDPEHNDGSGESETAGWIVMHREPTP